MIWNGESVMSATKHRPNFKIIENYRDESVDEYAFEKDYLNPNLTVPDLKKKYDLSQSQYNGLAEKVREKHNLLTKPHLRLWSDRLAPTFNGKFIYDMRYIRKWNHSYSIQKVIDGEKHNCGMFPDLETAQKVRDHLIDCGWDLDEFNRIKEEWKTRTPSYNKAVEKYPIWKKYYFNSLMSVDEINMMMNITSKIYYHLVRMIRAEYGITKRPTKSQRLSC